MKNVNVLIDGKRFFGTPMKNKEEAYEKIINMSKTSNCLTGNFLDYDYFSKHYRVIVNDLSRQIELENPDLKQQINFIGRLDRDNAATVFFIMEKSEETAFNCSQHSVGIA